MKHGTLILVATPTASAAFAHSGVKNAAATLVLFEPKEDDPMSEARDAIWTSYDDVTTKANQMEKGAAQLATTIDSAKDLGPAMNALGETCKAGHAAYRE